MDSTVSQSCFVHSIYNAHSYWLGSTVLFWDLREPGYSGAQSIPLSIGVEGHMITAIERDQHIWDPAARKAQEGMGACLQGALIFFSSPQGRSIKEGLLSVEHKLFQKPVIGDFLVSETLHHQNIISTFHDNTKAEGICLCFQGQASSKFLLGMECRDPVPTCQHPWTQLPALKLLRLRERQSTNELGVMVQLSQLLRKVLG